MISFRFFFHNHSVLSLLESGRSAICVPSALTRWARAGHVRVPIDVRSDEC